MAKPPMGPLAIANLMGNAAHKKAQVQPTKVNPDPDGDGDNDLTPAGDKDHDFNPSPQPKQVNPIAGQGKAKQVAAMKAKGK